MLSILAKGAIRGKQRPGTKYSRDRSGNFGAVIINCIYYIRHYVFTVRGKRILLRYIVRVTAGDYSDIRSCRNCSKKMIRMM